MNIYPAIEEAQEFTPTTSPIIKNQNLQYLQRQNNQPPFAMGGLNAYNAICMEQKQILSNNDNNLLNCQPVQEDALDLAPKYMKKTKSHEIFQNKCLFDLNFETNVRNFKLNPEAVLNEDSVKHEPKNEDLLSPENKSEILLDDEDLNDRNQEIDLNDMNEINEINDVNEIICLDEKSVNTNNNIRTSVGKTKNADYCSNSFMQLIQNTENPGEGNNNTTNSTNNYSTNFLAEKIKRKFGMGKLTSNRKTSQNAFQTHIQSGATQNTEATTQPHNPQTTQNPFFTNNSLFYKLQQSMNSNISSITKIPSFQCPIPITGGNINLSSFSSDDLYQMLQKLTLPLNPYMPATGLIFSHTCDPGNTLLQYTNFKHLPLQSQQHVLNHLNLNPLSFMNLPTSSLHSQIHPNQLNQLHYQPLPNPNSSSIPTLTNHNLKYSNNSILQTPTLTPFKKEEPTIRGSSNPHFRNINSGVSNIHSLKNPAANSNNKGSVGVVNRIVHNDKKFKRPNPRTGHPKIKLSNMHLKMGGKVNLRKERGRSNNPVSSESLDINQKLQINLAEGNRDLSNSIIHVKKFFVISPKAAKGIKGIIVNK